MQGVLNLFGRRKNSRGCWNCHQKLGFRFFVCFGDATRWVWLGGLVRGYVGTCQVLSVWLSWWVWSLVCRCGVVSFSVALK